MVVKGTGTEDVAKTSVYQMYCDYKEPLNQIKPHRVLAINRGEREGQLEVSIDVDVDGAIDLLKRKYTINNKYHADAIEDGLVRLLSPAVVREIRRRLCCLWEQDERFRLSAGAEGILVGAGGSERLVLVDKHK